MGFLILVVAVIAVVVFEAYLVRLRVELDEKESKSPDAADLF